MTLSPTPQDIRDPSFTRTLRFSWNNIQTSGKLYLIFPRPDPLGSLSSSGHPCPWRIIPFDKGNGYSENIIYTGDLGVAVVNSGSDNVATVINWAPIQPGHAIMIESGDHGARFSVPVFEANLGNSIKITNKSGERKDVRLGLHFGSDDGHQAFYPTCLFPHVGHTMSVQGTFRTTLYAIVNTDALDFTTEQNVGIWHKELFDLSQNNVTELILAEDSETGLYTMLTL